MSWTIAAAAASMLVAGAAAQDVPAMPAPTEIAGTDFCMIAGDWEYAPRWNFPDNAGSTMTIDECAVMCGEHPLCTGATFLDYPDNTDKKNCWMKSWDSPPAPAGTPCYGGEKPNFVYNAMILKNAATCAEVTFAADPVDCETDAGAYEEGETAVLTPKTVGTAAPMGAVPEAAAPAATPMADTPMAATPVAAAAPVAAGTAVQVATAASSYVGYTGYDYIPSDEMPPAVEVVDVGGGSAVADEAACAEECDATPGCNAGSYYGLAPEADWPAGKNCWLKTISVPCALPADASTDNAMAMLLMKITGEACPTGFVEQPDAAPVGAVTAEGPIAPGEVVPLATAPLPDSAVTIEGPPTTTDDVTTRDFDTETVATAPVSDEAADAATDEATDEATVATPVSAGSSGTVAAAVVTLAAAAALLV